MTSPSDHGQWLFQVLGECVDVVFMSSGRSRSIADVYLSLVPAIRLNQFVMLTDSRGRPAAFAAWAYVTEESKDRLASGKARFLEIGEWNEGTHVWVSEFTARPGFCRALARRLVTRLPPSQSLIWTRHRRAPTPEGRCISIGRRIAESADAA